MDLSPAVRHAVLVDTKTGDWQRLGRYVKDRREALRLTQQDVTSRGGPSVATLRNIEAATQDSYRGRTYSQLEDALKWARGSVDSVLRGREPTTETALHRTKTLGDLLVERGLRRPDELVISDEYEVQTDQFIVELLGADEFDEGFKDRWLSSYSRMRREMFEEMRRQKEKPRD